MSKLRGSINAIKEDSKLTKDAVRAARFLVHMTETDAGVIPDEVMVQELQDMINNGVVGLFYGLIPFIKTLIEAGELTPPPGPPEPSRIIIPHGVH